MLVVITIIALLAAVVLTTMKSLKEHGQKTKCKANLKSLAQGVHNKVAEDAWTMFASSFVWQEEDVWFEKRGWISWLDGNGNRPGYGGLTPPTGTHQPTCYMKIGATWENGRKAIEEGELWDYVNRDMTLYLCPKHKSTKVKTYPVCRSYIMNGYFFYSANDSGTEDGDGAGNDRSGGGWTNRSQRKMYDVPEAMRVMLFTEMKIVPSASEYNGTGRWGDAVLDAWGSKTPKGFGRDIDSVYKDADLQKKPYESIGFNHRSQGQNYGHVAFLDGHVREVPEWLDYPNQNTNSTLRAALGRW